MKRLPGLFALYAAIAHNGKVLLQKVYCFVLENRSDMMAIIETLKLGNHSVKKVFTLGVNWVCLNSMKKKDS